MADIPAWTMRGTITGDCNCEWGCPCNFDAPPSFGHCEGVYGFKIAEGTYGGIDLSGVGFIWYAYAPAAIHLGDMTAVVIVDDRASDEQFQAIDTLTSAGNVGMPFDGFVGLTTTFLTTERARIEFELGGDMRSTAIRANGGDIYELITRRVPNPVTGDEEELYLDKPTGFTSKHTELGMSTVGVFASPGMSFDIGGKYAITQALSVATGYTYSKVDGATASGHWNQRVSGE